MFTGRFGPGTGEVLFDRICRENGIRHLLTAPRSPTTTGKVERFHRTVKQELLNSAVFDTIEAAQATVDDWVGFYKQRPHQGIGMVPPIRRFWLAKSEPASTAPDTTTQAPTATSVGERSGVVRGEPVSGR